MTKSSKTSKLNPVTQGKGQVKDVALFIISYNLRIVIITLKTMFGKNFGCSYWHKELAEGE